MSRPLRIEYENAVYHVMNRGRGRSAIFHGNTFRLLFLDYFGEASQQFGLDVLAYCLMGNHYHLLVRTPRANLEGSIFPSPLPHFLCGRGRELNWKIKVEPLYLNN